MYGKILHMQHMQSRAKQELNNVEKEQAKKKQAEKEKAKK